MEDDGERDAGDDREGEAGQDLLEGHPAVVEEQGAIRPERLRDLARRRDQEWLDVERIGDHVEARGDLPQPEEDDDDHDRREPALHRGRLDSASRARSRAAVNSADVTISVRGLARGAGAASSPTARVGRGPNTITRSER